MGLDVVSYFPISIFVKVFFIAYPDAVCSGKLLLDTKGVIFVQAMVYWMTDKNAPLYRNARTRTGGLP